MTQTGYPSPTEMVDFAKALARFAHAGQTRSNGEPYFRHAERVAESALEGTNDSLAAVVGYLHDTIEDTTVTEDALLDVGFPPGLVYDVVALTRHADDSYNEYILKLIRDGSDRALAVKVADLTDNLRDIGNTGWSQDRIQSLRKRYMIALGTVLQEQDRRVRFKDYEAA
jgi:(p)ppGpp synthase/HD superfamily hydrolase